MAYSGLLEYLKEKLNGHSFLDIIQLLQIAMAKKTRARETTISQKAKFDRPHVNVVDEVESSDDETIDIYIQPNGLGTLNLNHSFAPLLSRWVIRIDMRK